MTKEHFICVFLNTKNRLIFKEIIYIGSLNATVVHPREVFRAALKHCSASLICAHYHSSDHPTPSAEDVNLTKLLVSVGQTVGIDVLDHVIIGAHSFSDSPNDNPDMSTGGYIREIRVSRPHTCLQFYQFSFSDEESGENKEKRCDTPYSHRLSHTYASFATAYISSLPKSNINWPGIRISKPIKPLMLVSSPMRPKSMGKLSI